MREENAIQRWLDEVYGPAVQQNAERQNAFLNTSGAVVAPVYGDPDDPDLPGCFPYTRGIHPSMYRSRLWTMRQYAGFGDAEGSNARYRYLLSQGQTGLSVAFDLPTQMGYDSDSPRAKGEVGRVGVAVDSLADMEVLLKDIPLGEVSTSMTINSTASTLLCLYLVVAERQGVPFARLRGTIQNDILKEYIARGTYVFPPRPSMRLITDIFAYCGQAVPKWNTISISGYHIREAGSTAAQEIAFTLADGIAYVEAAIEANLDVDDFAPRLAFFLNVHNNFFEEVAKFRAARRLWAEIMRDRFGAKNPRSTMLRFHTQTAGSTLTAQQVENNIVRVTMQALAAVLGGTQSLHTNSMDEALALPSEKAARIALRTQQVLAHETGVADVADPLGGSHYVEALTLDLYDKARALVARIDQLGGMVAAVEQGYPQRKIEQAAYDTQLALERDRQVVVGVNAFAVEEPVPTNLTRIDPDLEQRQVERLRQVRASRDGGGATNALEALAAAAKGSDNLMPKILDAVRCLCTVGEIADTLRGVFGEHRPQPPRAAGAGAGPKYAALAALPVLLATLAAPLAAATEEPPCATPRAAVHTLLHWQSAEQQSLSRAATCLDLSQEQRPAAGPLRAKQIKDVLDARGLLVEENDIPNDPSYRNDDGEPRYVPFASLPSFYLEPVGGRWLWSAATVAAVPNIHQRTFVLDVHAWVGGLPSWLQRSALGIAVWQLVGLLLLVVLAFIARALVMLVAASQARAVMVRIRARWGAEVLAHLDKPLGGLAGAAVVALLLPLLHLPVRLSQIGLLAARVWAAVSAVWGLYRLVDLLTAWLGKKAAGTETKLDDQLVPLVQKALKVFIVAVGTIFVLQNLNVDVAGLVAGLGLGGLAFALAAKETVANLFGSATIFADRPFHIGDWVKVGSAEGIVESVGFRSTKIRTFYNSLVSVPNSTVANAIVDNLGARVYRRCRTVLGVRYDTTPEQIQAFVDGIRAIITSNPHTRKDYYEVHFNDFGPSSLSILVYFFFKVPSWSEELRQRHNVLLEILRLAKALGVDFAFPTQTLQVESLAEAAAPAGRRVPTDNDLAAVVKAFAPGGSAARPLGPKLTDGYFAS